MTALFSILCSVAAAFSPHAVFEEANTAYGAGAYGKSAMLYEELIANGVHDPVVFYNLGNAYFSAGLLGPAVANYERALQLAPGFARARANLDHALGTGERHLARPLPPWWEQTVLFWHERFSPRFVMTVAMVSWCLFWGGLCFRRLRRFAHSRLILAGIGVVALAFGVSTWAKLHPPAIAVASRERVPVNYVIGDNETVHFELYAGDRVLLEERQGEWLLVATTDGKRGWAEASAMTLVGPPYEPAPASAEGESQIGGAG